MAFTILWENIQVAVAIIQTYQLNGDLKAESPIASLNGLLGPFMTSQMFRRADLELSMLDMNPQEHVEYYLQGRKNRFDSMFVGRSNDGYRLTMA